MTVGGIVLAAGEGRRFGAETKQLAELDGRPLLEHALDAMLAVPAIWPVVVVLGHEAGTIRRTINFGDVDTVVCEDWQDGQAASVKAGVRALGEVDAALITLGDQPLITPQVIAAVLDCGDGRSDAARATYDGRPGHPVLLKRGLLRRVHELQGDAGFRGMLAGARVRRFEAGHLCDPRDVDTREDLAAL